MYEIKGFLLTYFGFPIVGIMAVYGLEMLVTVIQAYVFTILTCVYLNDALHPAHWLWIKKLAIKK